MKYNNFFGKFKKPLGYVVVVIIFFFLLKSLISNWQEIHWAELNFNFLYLVLFFLFFCLSFIFGVWGWNLILAGMGYKISFKKSLKIIAASQLTKYVPGRIWIALGRAYLAEKEQIPKSKSVSSVILETQLLFLAALFSYFVTYAFGFSQNILGLKIHPLILAGLAILLLYPAWSEKMVAVIAKILKREYYPAHIGYKNFLVIFLVYLLNWVIQGLAFFFLLNSIYALNFSYLPYIVSSYILAWMIGFIVIFTPGGLGIREGALTYLLKFVMPLPVAIALSFFSRILITVSEIIFLLVSLKLKDQRE